MATIFGFVVRWAFSESPDESFPESLSSYLRITSNFDSTTHFPAGRGAFSLSSHSVFWEFEEGSALIYMPPAELFSFWVFLCLCEKENDQMGDGCPATSGAVCQLHGSFPLWVIHIQHSGGR